MRCNKNEGNNNKKHAGRTGKQTSQERVWVFLYVGVLLHGRGFFWVGGFFLVCGFFSEFEIDLN